MSLLIWSLLAFSLAVLAWTYLGYPLWMALLARYWPRPTAVKHWQPSVSVCMAVHNGMAHLDTKLDGLLAHDYPEGLLDIVVVSDGSDDGTAERLRARAGVRITALTPLQRRGKTACLADALALAQGEVLVFTDVRQRLGPGSIQALCDALASAELQSVSGVLALEAREGYSQSVDAYWRYESAIRRAEAATGSVVGVTGALYAVRRRDMPIPPAGLVLDDVWVPMRIALNGGRIGLAANAVAFDRASENAANESARKRRTLCGNWQLLSLWPELLRPDRHPLAWRFISHKVLRLIAPFWLLAAFSANTLLLQEGAIAQGMFALQCAGYACALVGMAWPATRRLLPIKLASAFLEMNAYAVLAFFDFLRSRDAHLWPAAASPPPNPQRPS